MRLQISLFELEMFGQVDDLVFFLRADGGFYLIVWTQKCGGCVLHARRGPVRRYSEVSSIDMKLDSKCLADPRRA